MQSGASRPKRYSPEVPSPLDTVSHLTSFARFVARRSAREERDGSTMAELARVDVSWPSGLDIEWLGTAGYRMTYQGSTLLIDPYLSRVPLRAVFSRNPVAVDRALHECYLPAAGVGDVVGVLVGHTHFDHAIDVPALCTRFDARAYGSGSLAHLMRLHGQPSVEVEVRRPYELGPFTVTFFPSLHSKLVLGYRVPFDGALTCDHLDGLCPSAYKCGEIYGIRVEVAGFTVYHQGSANLIDDEVPSGGADVFLAGIAGRSFTESYWARILPRLDPAYVVAGHYDDFFRPLSSPVGFTTNVNLTAVPDEIAAVTRDVTVATLPLPAPPKDE
jgi:L-ascorbate metabolism protein UlaG (beta-lactamase superfamily)